MELGTRVADGSDQHAHRRGDRGSTILVVAVAVVFAGLVAVATAELGVAMVHRQRAQLAADAAALAGLDGGRPAAVRLAALNGGRLVVYSRSGAAVIVEVRVGDASAHARATDGP